MTWVRRLSFKWAHHVLPMQFKESMLGWIAQENTLNFLLYRSDLKLRGKNARESFVSEGIISGSMQNMATDKNSGFRSVKEVWTIIQQDRIIQCPFVHHHFHTFEKHIFQSSFGYKEKVLGVHKQMKNHVPGLKRSDSLGDMLRIHEIH